ncbi:MAG: rhodanese-like domain-containing protein [Thermodesulfobacteriota bacterium]|nr:rhodanese-like domain-containing protein [Thermodesulfobacteriota bacterium]
MSPEDLKGYMEKNKEGDYLLVDVRQPEEYVRGHIPGAKLMPVRELVTDLSKLPSDKDLVFYCHSGGRSAAAATLVAEEEVSNKNIYDLEGGIMAWEGEALSDYPRVLVFDKSKTLPELLLVAMDLEKGALRFYDHLKQRYVSEPFSKTFAQLSLAEMAHAKSVYQYWKKTETDPPAFEAVFADLKGEILEGGENLIDTLGRAEALEGNMCMNFIELSLHIENAAFDLYRAMAEQTENQEARDAFLSIAQAEKKHMKTLIAAIGQCDEGESAATQG